MAAVIYNSSKTFDGYPCAHRRFGHTGHCAFVHGYQRSFTLWFSCSQRTSNGFVIDFGDLKWVHEFLTEHFDHTLLLDQADPLLHKFEELQALGACKLTLLPDVGCEGAAAFVFENANEWVRKHTDDRVWLESVECRENAKNSGKVTAIKHGVMW